MSAPMLQIHTQRRAVLSSLWIVVLFNMLFRDIHELARPGALEEYMAMQVPEGLLLASGVVLSLLIAMIVLNHVLSRNAARWANLLLSLLAIAGLASNPPRDLDDIWFLAVEVGALAAVMRLAWTWRPEQPEQPEQPEPSDASAATAPRLGE